MAANRIVVIGASAGGIETLRELVGGLSGDFPAPICVVMHTAPQSPGILAQILERAGRLPASTARSGEHLRPGHLYVAPPDCHLLVEPGRIRVTKGPRENRFRPAIDPLFRSAAQVFGPAAIGVILTGNLDDGTAGLWAIKQLGGVAIVQDPRDALFPSMPTNAINHVNVDHIAPLADIPRVLSTVAAAPLVQRPEAAVPSHGDVEVNIAGDQNPLEAGLARIAEPSSYACPECHGVLLRLKDGGRLRFRCHTGHAYSIESLMAAVSEAIDDSLWNTIRALEEGGILLQGLADHLRESHGGADVATLEREGAEARRKSNLIRELAREREHFPLDAVKARKS